MTAKPVLQRRRRRQAIPWLKRLLWLEPAWLLLLAPSLLFTDYFWDPTLRPLLIMALFLFWPFRLKTGQALLPSGAAGWFLGFLLLWLPVTVWQSPDTTHAWEVVGYVYFAFTTFVALSHWSFLHKHPQWLVLLLLAVGVGLAVVGPETFSVNPDKLLDIYRTEEFSLVDPSLRGETINPNILGSALVFLLPLGIALARPWPWTRWRWLPLLLWAPVLFMGNALILSQSRSSWIALLVASLLLCWFFWPRFTTWLILIALIGGGLVWWQYDVNAFLDNEILRSAQASLNLRLTIWRLALQLIADYPLTGIGLGNFKTTFTTYFPNIPLIGGALAPPHAHNLFVQLALDLGLPGLIAYLGLAATLLRSLLVRLQAKKMEGRLAYPLAIGIISACTAMVVVGGFDNALWGTKLLVIPWCLLALAYQLGDLKNSNASLIS